VRLTKIPQYSVPELERRAETLLRDRCGWPPSIPVDIESLVDQVPGVLLDILPGLQELCGVAGLARYEPDTDTMRVIIDAEVADHPSDAFYRFTVAEEFAHVLLKLEKAVLLMPPQDQESFYVDQAYRELKVGSEWVH
jgi:hypothetical protein